MNRHVKMVVFLAAIALIAVLIFSLKKEGSYGKEPAVKKIAIAEFVIKVDYPGEEEEVQGGQEEVQGDQEEVQGDEEELQLVRVKLLDIFLGVLGLAFAGVALTYVGSLVKGRRKQAAVAVGQETTAGVPAAEAPREKKLALEKVLGKTGTKILSIVMVVVIILVVLAIIILLFADKLAEKFPFLQKLFEALD